MENTPLWQSLTAEERDALKAEGVVKIGNGRPDDELLASFDWWRSKAGHAYWEGVFSRLEGCTYNTLRYLGFRPKSAKDTSTLVKGHVTIAPDGEGVVIKVQGVTVRGCCRPTVSGDLRMEFNGDVSIEVEA